jgi:hypothetical protein
MVHAFHSNKEKIQAKLLEMAEISLGYSFRVSVPDAPAIPTSAAEKAILVVQAKDISEYGIDFERATRVADVPIRDKFLLRPGDVVLQPRGVTYRAALVGDLPEPAMAAAPLFIIRTDARHLDPAFLTSFLNDPGTQASLRQMATGTHLPQVSRMALDQLEIPLPPLSKQRAIGGLAQLITEKRRLEQQINEHTLTLLRVLASGSESKKPKAR